MKKWLPVAALVLAALVLLVGTARLEQRAGAPSPSDGPAPVVPRVVAPSGVYPRGVAVALQTNDPRGQIVMTTDGTTPTAAVGTPYQAPLRLSRAYPGLTVVRAVEVIGDTPGPVLDATYLVGLEPNLPVVSLAVEPADLWDRSRGLFVNSSWRGGAWERPAQVAGLVDGEVAFSAPAGLRIDGREPPAAEKQALRLYVRRDYGVGRITAPLFPDHRFQAAETQQYKRLLLQAGDHTTRWTLLRDQLAAEVAADLGLPVAEGRFVWLFINGTSWGLYRLTERVDRFFLEDNLDIGSADVVREGDAREGSDDAWHALIDRVEAQDLANPEAYAALQTEVDVEHFIDVAILYHYFELPAESLAAVRPEGGRWFWVFEGGGAALETDGDFATLWRAMMANPTFRRRAHTRLSDLLNTVLAPEAVVQRLAPWSAVLAHDYGYERARWPGVPTWDEAEAALTTFAERRPAELFEAMVPATVTLTLAVDQTEAIPLQAGTVYVNGVRLPAFVDKGSWTGTYVAGTPVEVVAVPSHGFTVTGWADSSASLTSGAALSLTLTEDAAFTAHVAPVASDDTEAPTVAPDDVVINELWINDNGTRYPTLEQRPLEGDWVELLVRCPGPQDLRGWRLTDEATKAPGPEGSLILPDHDALAEVPCGTVILIVATETASNAAAFPADDLDARDGRLLLYAGNGNLDVTTDPGFAIGTNDDNVVLLAPGATAALTDDIGVDFVAEGSRVTPYTFGVLSDGVTFDTPFRYLGGDDGALFIRAPGLRRGLLGGGAPTARNDDVGDWIVDPDACASYDARCLGTVHLVTPGALNPGQRGYRWLCRLSPGGCR